MNQQVPDVPKFVQTLRRYRALIGLMATLGLLAGAVFAALNPPVFTSQALVIFPASDCPAGAICGGPMFAPDRSAYIGAKLLQTLPGGVQVKPFAANGLWVSATASTAAQAEAVANAAARSYFAYAQSLSYPGEQVAAQSFDPATTATGTPPLARLRADLLLGALFGALLGVIAALGGGGATIDTPTAPRGYDIGEEMSRASQETRYASTGVPLQQTALEYVNGRPARDRADGYR
ncbi:MAG: hypothetical protein ACRDOU_29720 [Streptosporangiaceae bacterium]